MNVRVMWASLVVQMVKNPLAMWEIQVWSFGWQDLLEKGMSTHFSILDWGIPMNRGVWWATVNGVTRLRHIWATKHTHSCGPWVKLDGPGECLKEFGILNRAKWLYKFTGDVLGFWQRVKGLVGSLLPRQCHEVIPETCTSNTKWFQSYLIWGVCQHEKLLNTFLSFQRLCNGTLLFMIELKFRYCKDLCFFF